jgi:hypothetical protein
MAKLSPEERESLPSSMQVPERDPRKVVEHTPQGSFADMTDLENRTPLSYRSNLKMHGVKQHVDCEATASADGHSGPATHLIRMPGERSDQVEAVCAIHHTRLVTNALERGGYDVASRRLQPEDVEPHNLHRAQQNRLMRTGVERGFYEKGMKGEDLLYGRSSEELGKGGGKGSTHFEEVMSRTTPEHRANSLEAALEHVRTHGGHNPPVSASPTVEVDGEDLTLGQSYAKVASLNRKLDEPIPGAKNRNTKNYYMAGIKNQYDTDPEVGFSLTRRYSFNKEGVPNERGGRKPKPVVEPPVKDESDVAPSTKGFLPGGKQRKARKVTMDHLPLTPYPTETPGTPDDMATISDARRTQKRSTDRVVKNIELNTEADRLREIEANKVNKTESRNKAFKVDWNDVPRPE